MSISSVQSDPTLKFCKNTGASLKETMLGLGYSSTSVNALNSDGEKLIYGTSFGAPNSIMASDSGYNLGKTTGISFGNSSVSMANASIFVPVGTLDIYNQAGIDPNSNPFKIDLSKATEGFNTSGQNASAGGNTTSSTKPQSGGKKYTYSFDAKGNVSYKRPDGSVATVSEVQYYDVATFNEAQKALKSRKKSS